MKKIICNICGKEFEEGSNYHAKIEISKRASPGNENVPGTKFHKKTFDLCFPCSMEVDKVLKNKGLDYIGMYKKFLTNQKKLKELEEMK